VHHTICCLLSGQLRGWPGADSAERGMERKLLDSSSTHCILWRLKEEIDAFIAIGLSLGVSFGCALGLLLGNIALGIGPGMAIGAAIGALVSKRRG